MKANFAFAAAAALALAAGTASAQVYPITNFDSFTAGNEALFKPAVFSGSTNTHIATTPASTTAVSTEEFVSAPNSLKATWSWNDSNNSAAWVRFTTFNATNVPNPQLNATKILELKVKITTGAVQLVAINARDSASNTGPVGAAGEVASALETLTPAGSPIVLDSAVNNNWQTIQLNLATATVTAFTGNGTLENQWLTWDSIRFQPVAGQTAVVLYIDDVQMVDPANVSDWTMY